MHMYVCVIIYFFKLKNKTFYGMNKEEIKDV